MKEYANEIAPVLAKIFQQSIESGDMPKKWKNANVTAFFKKGSRSDRGNYRPIFLTCIASKVLEHIVHSHIMKYLEQCNIFTDLQHGFGAKRSTVTQLVSTIYEMSSAINNDATVHATILDFEKALDKVPQERLLRKLQCYGIQGPLFNWLKLFLTGRYQTVVFGGGGGVKQPNQGSYLKCPSRNGIGTTIIPLIYKRPAGCITLSR